MVFVESERSVAHPGVDVLKTSLVSELITGACLDFFQWGCTIFLFNNRVFCVVDFIIHFGNT